MKTSYRTTLCITVLAMASLTLPSLVHAKRLGGGLKPKPSQTKFIKLAKFIKVGWLGAGLSKTRPAEFSELVSLVNLRK